MTGTFSIKRRKQEAPHRVFHALGIGIGRTSPHVASKPGHIHVRPADSSAARAQMWAADTGRPIPPHLRARSPLQPPAALTLRHRAAEYVDWGKPLGGLEISKLLADPRFTPAQRRRLRRKAGAHGELPAGSPRVTQPRVKRPRTPAQRQRAARNARQQARHQARLP